MTRARLRKLERAGYIGSKPFKTVDGSPNIYFLRERASDHIEEDFRRVKLPKPLALAHTLDLTTIQIHIEAWFRDHPTVALPWIYSESKMHLVGGRYVRTIHDRYIIGGRVTTVTPDMAFALEHKGQDTRLLVFVENDRSTESHNQLRQKFDQYRDYMRRSERFKKKFNVTFDRFLVLFITTSSKRIAGVQKKHRHHPVFPLLRLTTMKDFEAASDPARPIWTRREGERVGLVK